MIWAWSRNLADEVVVMYRGRGRRIRPRGADLSRPRHPYLRALMQAVPHFDMPQDERLRPLVPVTVDSSRLGAPAVPRFDGPLLQVAGLTKSARARAAAAAVRPARARGRGCRLFHHAARRWGWWARSGSGKTTVGKMIVRAITPDSGASCWTERTCWPRPAPSGLKCSAGCRWCSKTRSHRCRRI